MSNPPRDHRAIGQRLDLFHLQAEAPGSVFWHPRGWSLFRRIEDRVRRVVSAQGYAEVRTPLVIERAIWEKSGHWQSFRADMLQVGEDAALKPVSCPGHIQLYLQAPRSDRELPLRLAEFGLVHRNEHSGALQGLFRLRQFTQDDGHLFLSEGQLVEEAVRFCGGLERLYRAFGFGAPEVALSTRPAQRAGAAEVWDRAEAGLREAARAAGLSPIEQPGQGAFYGPKLEFALRDSAGRSWQCGTLQLDFVLPERFGLSYVGPNGGLHRPVMLHRAMLGSLERFLAVLLEHHGGGLPLWLCEEQVRVLLLPGGAAEAARAFAGALGRAGLRARVQAGDAIGELLAGAHADEVPFTIAWGAKESDGRVRLRPRHGALRQLAQDEAIAELALACAEPPLE